MMVTTKEAATVANITIIDDDGHSVDSNSPAMINHNSERNVHGDDTNNQGFSAATNASKVVLVGTPPRRIQTSRISSTNEHLSSPALTLNTTAVDLENRVEGVEINEEENNGVNENQQPQQQYFFTPARPTVSFLPLAEVVSPNSSSNDTVEVNPQEASLVGRLDGTTMHTPYTSIGTPTFLSPAMNSSFHNTDTDISSDNDDALYHDTLMTSAPASTSIQQHIESTTNQASVTQLPLAQSEAIASPDEEVKQQQLNIQGNESADEIKAKIKKRRENRNLQRSRRLRNRAAIVHEVISNGIGKMGGRIGVSMPCNQYETILIRRAVRKLESYDSSIPNQPTSNDNNNNNNLQHEQIYGDVSLGMKLSVHSGLVIVHHLKSLDDGRASPAQLAGVISPGDVLISVNDKSLINLPLEQLMYGLNPLSKPDSKGNYHRRLKLRFAVGIGLKYLPSMDRNSSYNRVTSSDSTTNEQQLANQRYYRNDSNASTDAGLEIAREMLALFPMVDQLSGMPLFEEHQQVTWRQAGENNVSVSEVHRPKNDETKNETTTQQRQQPSNSQKKQLTVHDRISKNLATLSTSDRTRILREYYSWNQNFTTQFPLGEDDQELEKECWNSLSDANIGGKSIHLPTKSPTSVTTADISATLAVPDLVKIGRKAVLGALALSKQMEDVDEGKDVRSFRSLSTTLSLYSRASTTRRRRVLDNPSLAFLAPVERVDEEDNESDDEVNNDDDDNNNNMCNNTSFSDDEYGDRVDGDELIVRLASHDEIWRKQLIDFLEQEARAVEEDNDDEAVTNAADGNILQVHQMNDERSTTTALGIANNSDVLLDDAIANELGNFLLGEKIVKLMKKPGNPRSLPSDEVTAVLFDLATKVVSSIPDEIISGSNTTKILSTTPYGFLKQQQRSTSVLLDDEYLATRFLLDEAVPAWLKSFKPLPWEHRRILWPLNPIETSSDSTNNHNRRTTTSSVASDDLTLESVQTRKSTATTGTTSAATTVRPTNKKDIASIIEDREMNVETRGEACFLVTFYFTHALLPQLNMARKNIEESQDEDEMNHSTKNAMDNIMLFMDTYGSYLKLYTCFVYSAALQAHAIISVLLNIATHDPVHKEAVKRISKSNQLVFYEPTLLSAIVQRLYQINDNKSNERRHKLIELCAAAFPDLLPWQVQKVCIPTTNEENNNNNNNNELTNKKKASSSDSSLARLYYTYLSYLLHASDGHEAARRDPKLVSEWCTLSLVDNVVGVTVDEVLRRRDNFLLVASRQSNEHHLYHRDRVVLLGLCMKNKEYALALDLADEILKDKQMSTDERLVTNVLSQLRSIGLDIIETNDTLNTSLETNAIFAQILQLYKFTPLREFGNIPMELCMFLDKKKSQMDENVNGEMEQQHPTSNNTCSYDKVFELIQFMAKVAVPSDILQALERWLLPSDIVKPELYTLLQDILKRGLMEEQTFALSKSRLFLRLSRKHYSKAMTTDSVDEYDDNMLSTPNIWTRMTQGKLSIEK